MEEKDHTQANGKMNGVSDQPYYFTVTHSEDPVLVMN